MNFLKLFPYYHAGFQIAAIKFDVSHVSSNPFVQNNVYRSISTRSVDQMLATFFRILILKYFIQV